MVLTSIAAIHLLMFFVSILAWSYVYFRLWKVSFIAVQAVEQNLLYGYIFSTHHDFWTSVLEFSLYDSLF